MDTIGVIGTEIWAQQKKLWAYAGMCPQDREEDKTLSYPYQTFPMYAAPYNLKNETLAVVEPWVQNGLKEAQAISVEHALREAAAVTYLIGRGYHPQHAHRIVESWWHMN